jgi:hypothetical protein
VKFFQFPYTGKLLTSFLKAEMPVSLTDISFELLVSAVLPEVACPAFTEGLSQRINPREKIPQRATAEAAYLRYFLRNVFFMVFCLNLVLRMPGGFLLFDYHIQEILMT